MITTLDSGFRKAAKRQQCDYCRSSIERGTRYCYQSNVMDSQVYAWRTHFHCTAQHRVAWGLAQELDPEDVTDELLYELSGEEARRVGWRAYLVLCRRELTVLRREVPK